MDFNIHDLLCFRVSGENRRYLEYLGEEYSFFKTDESPTPDIEVIISDAINTSGDGRLVGNKYFVKDGHLHCRDRYKMVRWRLSMDDLEGRTVVHFSGGLRGEYILKDFFLEPLIGFKLAARGCAILHASAMAINDAGFVFAGGPESGKTASLLSLDAPDNTFLADETTVLSHDGVIYSLPLSIRIYHRNLKDMTSLASKLTPRQKLEAKTKQYIYRLSLGYIKLPLCIRPEKLFNRIGGACPLRCLTLLTRTQDEGIGIRDIADKKDLVERLIRINEQQFPYWCKYVSAYSSVYPSSRVASYSQVMKEHLSQALDRVACYEIKIPHRLPAGHREELQQVMKTLERDAR
jgi:hypothetical protein